MSKDFETARVRGKLLLCIVERGHGERLVAATKRLGAQGGTILLGRGTAESSIAQLFGMGDTEKDIVITMVGEAEAGRIVEAFRPRDPRPKHRHGVLMEIDVPRFLRRSMPQLTQPSADAPSPMAGRRGKMDNENKYELITFIVNRGYADDAMAAAREAGARGGTIVNARGTGKEEDVKFFGITLVPEKEILIILVDTDKADRILEAVRSDPCLSQPGAGIAFSVDVEDFVALGGEVPLSSGSALH